MKGENDELISPDSPLVAMIWFYRRVSTCGSLSIRCNLWLKKDSEDARSPFAINLFSNLGMSGSFSC